MKVLNILGSLNYSGAEIMILATNNDFKKKGIVNDILITQKIKGNAYYLFKKKNFYIEEIFFSKLKILKILINFFIFIKILLFLLKKRYDVVIIHTEANTFKLALASMIVKRTKIIRVVHNVFNPNLILRLRRKLIFYFLKFFRVKIVSVSRCVKKNEFKLYKNRSFLINNFLNHNKFRLLKNKIKDKNLLKIFVVGNCSKIKNHQIIFKSLSKLPSNINWRLTHIGKECQFKNERILAKRLGILKKCKFLGEVFDWSKYVNRNDIYINSSTNEGIGISNLEACSLGMIPLLSNVPGNKTILNSIKNISDLQFSNEESLLKKILKISNYSNNKKNLVTKKISKKINTLFSKDKYVNSYFNLLNKN